MHVYRNPEDACKLGDTVDVVEMSVSQHYAHRLKALVSNKACKSVTLCRICESRVHESAETILVPDNAGAFLKGVESELLDMHH